MLLSATSRQHSRGAMLLLFILCCLSASQLATAATNNCSLWVSQTNNCQDRLRCYTSILSAYEAIPSVAPYCDTGIGLYLTDTAYSGLSSCNIVLGSLKNVPYVEIVSLAATDNPSSSGATTSINCTGKWMHLAFQNPNYEIVVSGINFNTGSGYFAGSMEVQNAKAPIVLTNCRFYDNVGTAAGAVSITTNSTLELNDVIFSSNFATSGAGGGLALTLTSGQPGTEVLFNNTVFKHNTASGNGGGFWINGADPIQMNITSLSASDNKALGGGGGTGFINGGSFTMVNVDLRTNVAQLGGGALWVQQVNWGLIENATVHNNTGGLYGGGIFMNNTNVQITNAEVMQNIAQEGGGLYIAQTDSWRQNHTTSNSILDSVVVSGNEATSYGGGIYVNDAVSEWKGVLFKSNKGKAQPGFSQNDNEVYCTPYAQTQYCTRCSCSDECASCSAQGCSLLSSGSCVCYVEQSLKDECDNDNLPGNEGHHHRTGRILGFLFGLGVPLAILAGVAAYYGIRRYRRRTYLSLDTTEGL